MRIKNPNCRNLFLCLSLPLIALGGCSQNVGPKTQADKNADIDRQIADVKSRTDIPALGKQRIIEMMSRGKKGAPPPATPPQ